MANIRKSFNFRNGVQVDDDNFIVNPNGLVGIGSTVPTESLDVLGNVRIRGSLLVDNIQADSIVNTSETGSVSFNIVNVGITSITSGIVSATSGIVTYYGDGSNLQGLPTSQWVDINPDINGYESIYAQGSVGIATTNPLYTFQVGGTIDINSFGNGVGIASEGDIRATRDINIGRNLNITGITTVGSNLYVSGFTTVGSNLYVSGIITASSFNGFGTNISAINATNISSGTLNNDRLPSNINKPSGITTFSAFYGNLVGIATTARNLTTDANIDIVSIVSDYSNLGITTVSTLNATTSIGIGTNNANSDFHVRRVGSDAEIQITSDTNTAKLVIGQDVTLTNNNTIIQFNDTSGSVHPESGENCFDIINYAPGNFNSFIRPESTPNLKFNWINYSTNEILMSLTHNGNLGVGKTNPTETFEVVGTSTVTSTSYFGSNVYISGTLYPSSLSVSGTSILNSSVGIGTNSSSHDFQVGGNPNNSIGLSISRNGNLKASGIITASSFSGDGSNITNITPSNISSGTIENVNINSSSGIITASSFSGDGSNITNITPSNISSGTIENVNINSSSGIITAYSFSGFGTNITGIDPSNIESGTLSEIGLNSPNQSIICKNINSPLGIITANSFSGIGSEILNINPSNIKSDYGSFTNGRFTFVNASVELYPDSNINYGDNSIIIDKSALYSEGSNVNFVSAGVGLTILSLNYGSSDYFYDNIEEVVGVTDSKILTFSFGFINSSGDMQQTDFKLLVKDSSSFVYDSTSTLSIGSSICSIIAQNTEADIIDLLLVPNAGQTGIVTWSYFRNSIYF
jgi:hypothetical protein